MLHIAIFRAVLGNGFRKMISRYGSWSSPYYRKTPSPPSRSLIAQLIPSGQGTWGIRFAPATPPPSKLRHGVYLQMYLLNLSYEITEGTYRKRNEESRNARKGAINWQFTYFLSLRSTVMEESVTPPVIAKCPSSTRM